MKKILIPPRFKVIDGNERAYMTNTHAEISHLLGCLPIMPSISQSFSKNDIASAAREYVSEVSGVMLQGGNDVDPTLYGEKPKGAIDCQPYRDTFELAIISEALKKRIPILGICRGFQLLNVFFGGSLEQDLTSGTVTHIEIESGEIQDAEHSVTLTDSVLRELYEKKQIMVNSYHHQGIKTLGQGLTIEAQADDGLIEAFSLVERHVLAVQWHPELDLENKDYKKLFTYWFSWIKD